MVFRITANIWIYKTKRINLKQFKTKNKMKLAKISTLETEELAC
jgi:hypothetical protein